MVARWSAPTFRTAVVRSDSEAWSHMGVISEGRKVHVQRKGKAKPSGCRGKRDCSPGGGGSLRCFRSKCCWRGMAPFHAGPVHLFSMLDLISASPFPFSLTNTKPSPLVSSEIFITWGGMDRTPGSLNSPPPPRSFQTRHYTGIVHGFSPEGL